MPTAEGDSAIIVSENRRVHQLDALRGLAALSVVIHHCLIIFPLLFDDTLGQPGLWPLNLFKYSPLHLFWAGNQAVYLFFLLSGFVLSLPFYTQRHIPYFPFLIKRACRIYLPYLTATTGAVILDLLFARHGIQGLSRWFNGVWREQPSIGLVIQHALLIDQFDPTDINPVIWSLVQEMRVSLMFPLLPWLINRYGWRFPLFLAVGLFGVGELTAAQSNGAITVNVIAFFLLGALLAKYYPSLSRLYQRQPRWAHGLLFGGAIFGYTAPWWLYPVQALRSLPALPDTLCVLGSLTMIFLALASHRLKRWLLMQPLVFLGRISYSVYLYHAIILLAAINLLYGSLPLWLILLGVGGATLMIGTAAYYGIEKPSIMLGQALAKSHRLVAKQTTEAPPVPRPGRIIR